MRNIPAVDPPVADPWTALAAACSTIDPPTVEQMDTAAAELAAWTAGKWPPKPEPIGRTYGLRSMPTPVRRLARRAHVTALRDADDVPLSVSA